MKTFAEWLPHVHITLMSLDWQPVVSNVENMGTNAVHSSIPNRKLKIYFRKIKLVSSIWPNSPKPFRYLQSLLLGDYLKCWTELQSGECKGDGKWNGMNIFKITNDPEYCFSEPRWLFGQGTKKLTVNKINTPNYANWNSMGWLD